MPNAVFDSITIWVQAFIPMPMVPAPTGCFHGDGRDFSDDPNEQRYRVRSQIDITGFTSGAAEFTEFHQVGETQLVDCETAEVLETAFAETDRMSFHDFQVGNTYPDPEGGVIDLPNEESAGVQYDGASANPLLPSPDVDINLFLWVDSVGRTLYFHGAVNAFPDYEAYASVDGGPVITLFRHPHNLEPLGGLPGGADQVVTGTLQV
jgi:hypothetical protein